MSTRCECVTFWNSPYEFSKHVTVCLENLPRETKSYSWVSLYSHQSLIRIPQQQEATWLLVSWLNKIFWADLAWSQCFLTAMLEDRRFKWQDFGLQGFAGNHSGEDPVFQTRQTYAASWTLSGASSRTMSDCLSRVVCPWSCSVGMSITRRACEKADCWALAPEFLVQEIWGGSENVRF